MVELTADGLLELKQFWPDGTSDADTTKIIVTANQFFIRNEVGGPSRETHVFDGAKVKGKSGTKPVLTTASKLTVRLQGIDAPELHYKAPPLKSGSVTAAVRAEYNSINKEFRQQLGETSTLGLLTFLKTEGVASLPCSAVTVVNKPNDVFDTYGRFVGDIRVTIGGIATVINQWLVRNGWAYPAFYNSMKPEEITTLIDAAKQARANNKLVWKHLTGKIGTLDRDLIFRGKGAIPDPAADTGPVIMPKLFRRLAAWTMAKKAGVPDTPSNFRKALEKAATADAFYLTDDFLENTALSAEIQVLPDFLDVENTFTLKPDEIVFRESASTLIGSNGQLVEDWD